MEIDEKILAMRNELREKIIHPEKNIDKETLEKELTSSIYDDNVNIFGKTKSLKIRYYLISLFHLDCLLILSVLMKKLLKGYILWAIRRRLF